MRKSVQKQIAIQKVVSSALIGNRVPKEFFIAKGKGESEITVHAGSYHLALKDAGIERCNIMTYSSILPAIATEIEKPQGIVHGSVMETIMAVANSESGRRATAGIIYGWLHDNETGEKYGGLVCEYNGHLTEEEAAFQLRQSLEELYTNGYSDKFKLMDIRFITESIVPSKRFGTAIVSLCFTSYVVPVVDKTCPG